MEEIKVANDQTTPMTILDFVCLKKNSLENKRENYNFFRFVVYFLG